MNFVALDVETANPDMSSICQIGIVNFESGRPTEVWSSFVDPQDHFDEVNVSIHRITQDDVRGAPKFKEISEEVNRRVNGRVVAIHTAFDRSSISQAAARHGAMVPECLWLNTASVARRAWPDVAQRGYGLSPLAEKLGIKFQHHSAADDALVAGMILVQAIGETGIDLPGWISRVELPLNPNRDGGAARHGDPEGPLYGEVVAFTGALINPRHEAADMAARAGCEVASGVTKHTTLLVVGDQDIRKLNGQVKSTKHRKAEELIGKGHPIRILTETDFFSMVAPRARTIGSE